MKITYLALSLLSSLAVAQSLIEDDCQCPQVKCPATNTLEGCRCVNLAELRCKQRCPNYTPTKFRICRRPKQTPTPLVLPFEPSPTPVVSVPAVPESVDLPDLPLVPDCECEERMCIQIFPGSCHCAWGNAKKCYDKCGGPSPGLNTCPSLDPLPAPVVPEPVIPEPAVPSSVDLPDLPLVPGCECEEMMCIQSYPDSCHCAWGIAKNCYDKCGGPSPGLNTCPPLNPVGGISLDGPVKRDAAPESQDTASELLAGPKKPRPTKPCKCEQTVCIQSWPASCYCANAAKKACQKKCGGAKPILQTCPGPKPKPTPKPVDESRKQRICGGGRGSPNPQCPDGYICMNDPYKTGCGLECDGTGICVKDELCGGFAGFRCPDSRQICVDKPDDCDPENGGADCGGVCVWPPSLRYN